MAGVLAYKADDDYDRGRQLLEQGASLDAALRGDRPQSADEDEVE